MQQPLKNVRRSLKSCALMKIQRLIPSHLRMRAEFDFQKCHRRLLKLEFSANERVDENWIGIRTDLECELVLHGRAAFRRRWLFPL